MAKILVVYRSKYGATKRYAEMMAARSGAELRENGALRAEDVARHDTVLFFCAVYASGLSGLQAFTKNRAALAGKRVAVFGVGASPYDEAALAELKTRAGLADIPLFYGRGAWNEAQMSFKDRTLCKLLRNRWRSRIRRPLLPADCAHGSAGPGPVTGMDEKYLAPLERWLAQS